MLLLPANDPSHLGAGPRRDLLIHCSGPEEKAEIAGCSSNKAAWITLFSGLAALCIDSWLCY